MKPDEIERWLWEGREATISTLELGNFWWPDGTQPQRSASAWALAFFLKAAKDRLSRFRGAHATVCPKGKDNHYRQILDALWTPFKGEHWPHEMLVDFSVLDWRLRSPILLTAESEVAPRHGVKDSITRDDDYSWDFFKLLVIPSPRRLFFARVGAIERGSGRARLEELVATLKRLVKHYGEAFLRERDELGAVIVSGAKADAACTKILWLEAGKLESRLATKLPPLRQK